MMANGSSDTNGSSLADVPAIRTFQFDKDSIGKLKNSVNMFRGDVNFPLALLTLPGSAGLEVNLTAIYESNVQQQVKLWNLDAPTGIIGLGWALPYEQIVSQNSGSGAQADEQIYLVSGGANRLVRTGTAADGSWTYQAQNFQFWDIRYYPSDERWEITKENGITSIYGGGVAGSGGTGTSTGESVQWGVKWGNWIGNSAVTLNQQYFAKAWNLSKIRNLWDQSIQFEYLNIKQAVGQGGKSYTKACYLQRIQNVYGRTANFNYADKIFQPGQICEYQDPHKVQPNDFPDAYQSRYETKYLDSIEVRSETDTRLFSIKFDYDLFNAGGSGQADFPFLWKRRLISIRQLNADFESLPGMQFEYYDRGDLHPGAIKSITYPEGGDVKYNYTLLTLPTNRDVEISNPFTGTTTGTPRVWFGLDYTVVTWADPTGGRLQVSIYSWLGRWVSQNVPFSAKFNLDSLVVETGQDFFVLSFQETSTNQQRVYLFRRDPLKSGQWTNTPQFLTLKAGAPATTVVAGNDFVILYNPGFTQRPFQGFTWNWRQRQWLTPALPTLTLTDPPAVRLATGQNCYVVCSYNRQTKTAQFNLLSRDDMGNWGKNSAWSNNFTVYQSSTSPTDFLLTLSMGASFVVATYLTDLTATTAKYELRLFQWDENFNVINPSSPFVKAYSSPVSGSEIQMPILATLVADAMVGNSNHLLRYTGSGASTGWLNFDMGSPTDANAKYDFGYQADAAVLSKSVSSSVTDLVTTFNPNVPTAGGWSSQNVGSQGVSPTIAQGYMSVGNRVYHQGPSGSWTQLTTPLPGTIDLPSLQNRAPNYIVYQDNQGDSTRTYVALLRNGAISEIITLTPDPQKVYVPQDNPKPGTILAGPTSFFTYPSKQKFDSALSLHLYQLDDDAVQGPVVDIPVSYLELDDGYVQDTPYLQTYRYDLTSVVVEPGTRVAQYPKVTVIAGSKDDSGPAVAGRTEYYYSNGYSQQGGTFYPIGWIFNYELILNGVLLGTRAYDSNNQLLAQNIGYWKVTNISGQNFLYGGYFRQVKNDNTLDGVKQTTETIYDVTTGLPTQTKTTSMLGGNVEKVFTKELTYAWQVTQYASAMLAKHLYEPVAQTINQTDGVVTASSVTTWQNWDQTGQTWRWSPFQSYKWLGTGAGPTFDFTPGSPRTDWLKVSEINSLVMSSGVINESSDVSGVRHSLIYDKRGIFQIASFLNASIQNQQAGYLGFEDYESSDPWTISPATPIVNNEAYTGNNSLKLPPGTNGPANSFQASGDAGDFLLSCWVKTENGFGGDGGDAAWVIQISHNGNSVGSPIVVPIVDTNGAWSYLFKLIPLIELREANGLQPNDPLSLALSSYNHKQTKYLLLDDIRVSPFVCNFTARTIDEPYRIQTTQLNSNGATIRFLYDGFQRQIAKIGPGTVNGPVNTVNSNYYSRQGNSGVFNPADPNRSLSIQARAGGFYENLHSGEDWQDHWTAVGDWQQQGGTLVHQGQQQGTLTLKEPVALQRYGLRFSIASDQVLQNLLGIKVGNEITIAWNPATGQWSLSAPGLNQPLSSGTPAFNLNPDFVKSLDGKQVTSDIISAFSIAGAALSSGAVIDVVAQGTRWTIRDAQFNQSYYLLMQGNLLTVNTLARQWLLSLGEKTLLFYADGQQVFSYISTTPIAGSPQIFVADTVAYSNLLAFQDPQVSVSLQDGAARQRQTQVLGGEQAIVTQGVYDDIGRAAVQTKSAFMTPDGSHRLLDYREDFVTSLDWTTGIMTGKISDAYPDDEGYPYTRQLFDNSPLGRAIEKGEPGKAFAINLNDPARHTITYKYSASDGSFGLQAGEYFVTTTTDQEGITSLVFSDKTRLQIGKAVNVGTNEVTRYLQSFNEYDAAGNLVTIKEPNFFEPNNPTPENWVITQEYFFLGNLKQQTTPDTGTTKYIYDQAGRVRFIQDAQGASEGYLLFRKYDSVSRMTETGYYESDWNWETLQELAIHDPNWPQVETTWRKKIVYDGDGTDPFLLGRVWKIFVNNDYGANADLIEDYTYDMAGNILEAGTQANDFDGQRYATRYTYDNVSNVVTISYPGPSTSNALPKVFYAYNDLGQVSSIGTSENDSEHYATYLYTANGSIAQEKLNSGSNALTRQLTYNPPGWTKQVDSHFQNDQGEFAVSLDYTSGGYDPADGDNKGFYNGQVAQQSNNYNWQQGAPAPSNYAYHYDYDKLGRLTTAEDTPDHSHDLGVGTPLNYDPNGNILTVDRAGLVQQYSYYPTSNPAAASNRLLAITNQDGSEARSFDYNFNGCVKTATSNARTLSFLYDRVINKAKQIDVNEGGSTRTLRFAYSSSQQRVLKTDGINAKLYLRGNNAYPLAELTKAGGGQQSEVFYIYGPSGMLAMLKNSAPYYILKDQQNSVRVVLDQAGAVVAGYDYWPYGSIARSYGQTDIISYLYTGQEFDSDLGLYNYVARFYDSDTGRFYAPDPSQQFFSPYIYGANNPILFIDPTGEFAWWEGLLMGLTAILGIAAIIFTAGAAAPAVVGAEAALAGADAAAAGAEIIAAGVEIEMTEMGAAAAEAAISQAPRAAAILGEEVGAELSESASVAAASEIGAESEASSAASSVRFSFREWINPWGDQGGYTTMNRIQYTGWRSFLNDLGVARYNPVVTNNEVPGTWGYIDTEWHEGFHALVARNLPVWTQVGNATVGRVPVGASFIYVEELFAYSIGHIAAGRLFALPLVPLEAFGSLTAAERVSTLVTFGLIGGGVAAGKLIPKAHSSG